MSWFANKELVTCTGSWLGSKSCSLCGSTLNKDKQQYEFFEAIYLSFYKRPNSRSSRRQYPLTMFRAAKVSNSTAIKYLITQFFWQRALLS